MIFVFFLSAAEGGGKATKIGRHQSRFSIVINDGELISHSVAGPAGPAASARPRCSPEN